VRGHGRQKGHTETYRGREYDVDLLPKVKLELVLNDEIVDRVIKTVLDVGHTGKIGDGKIFVYKVDDVIRIRNQQHGPDAI
jgi:nitrogen regulatory protein P-II 1